MMLEFARLANLTHYFQFTTIDWPWNAVAAVLPPTRICCSRPNLLITNEWLNDNIIFWVPSCSSSYFLIDASGWLLNCSRLLSNKNCVTKMEQFCTTPSQNLQKYSYCDVYSTN
jgi:hypothetical protein